MASFEADSLLKPISEAEPSGPDLRHDGRFMQVVRDAEGTPDDPFTNTPGKEPNWREVRDGCVELLARARDLRVAVLLALCESRLDGYAGLERGLKVVRGCIETFWDSVHPQLDPEDAMDPLMRANILSALSAPIATFGDTIKFLERVRSLPLCESRQLGRYSLEDFAIASGALALPEGSTRTKPEITVIEAAFQETDLEKLQATLASVEACSAHVQAIQAAFNAKVKPNQSVDLSGLTKLLADVLAHLRRHVAARTGAPAPDETGGGGPQSGGAGGGHSGGAAISGQVRSSGDVRVALDAVIQYYEANEPSSPVALIVKCAKQAAGKDFLTLSELIDPEAVKVLRKIGIPEAPPPK